MNDVSYLKNTHYKNLKIYYDKKNIANIINKSDILVSNGGTSCLEGYILKRL